MKGKVFDFTKRPENKDEEAALANAWAIIMDGLSVEDEERLHEEFATYRDNCIKQGVEYTPAYLWSLQRVKVSL
jgi:hypothetical protein